MKTFLLASAGVAVLGIGHAPAILAQASPLAFEVASVKPVVLARNQFTFGAPSRGSAIRIRGNRVTTEGILAGLVLTAYDLRSFQLSRAPEWRDEANKHQLYAIEAKAPGDGAPSMDEARQMLQTLLAERFQLKFHRETKELPAYALMVGADPPKLEPSAPDVESKTVSVTKLRTVYHNVSMSELVLQVGSQFDRPLFDRTGLQGGYEFALEYMPSFPRSVYISPETTAAIAEFYGADEAPPLPVALQRQLGLKIVPTKEQVEILVIDHVDRPSAN